MTVGRQEPSSSSTMKPTSKAAITISCTTSAIACFTKPEASMRSFTFTPLGTICSMRGMISLIPCTTSSVDASLLFITTMMTACWPSTTTAFVCTRPARRVTLTSRRWIQALPSFLIGMSSKSSIFSGCALVRTIQSVDLILMSPPGSTRFCLSSAWWISSGVRCRASNFC